MPFAAFSEVLLNKLLLPILLGKTDHELDHIAA